jgi:hypothetical protein
MGGARARHRIHPCLSRGGNATNQLNRAENELSSSRKNAAAAYSETNVDSSAMATGRHGDHAPVPVELGRKRGWSATEESESGQQREGADTIADHGSPHTPVMLLVKSRVDAI